MVKQNDFYNERDINNVNDEDYWNDSLMNEDSMETTPQNMDGQDTFKQRNDPSELLEKYKLQLMNAYKVKEETEDKDGNKKITFKIKRKNNTKPRANKQGVEDIISYLEKMVNGHTVQGNISSEEIYNQKMLSISQNMTTHFMARRVEWGIDINDVDILIQNAIILIDLFLTRPIDNKERELYGITYKETRHSDQRPVRKRNTLENIGSFLAGKRNK